MRGWRGYRAPPGTARKAGFERHHRALSAPSGVRNEGQGAPFLHSFHKAFPGAPPKVHVRGEGVYVYDQDGKRILDGLAGLWSVSLGYGQTRIVDAAAKQMSKLPFFHTFWNQGHDVGYELAHELLSVIPWRAEKIAFTSGGSDANDTAIKMVWFYHNALGQTQKKKVIARNKAYHGVTSVAASCSGLPGLQGNFGAAGAQNLPLPGFIHVTCPHMYRWAEAGEDEDAFASRLAAELEDTIVREGPETVGAMIAEPLMGAGGVMPPPRGYFEKVRAITRKHKVLLISDEVVCGFGRLGSPFGCTAYGFEPDLMTMAKAITSSYAPMGAVAISPHVAAVLAEGSEGSLFGHGYTFGAHPVSCAVALECLRIFKEDRIEANVAARAQELLAGLRAVAETSPIAGSLGREREGGGRGREGGSHGRAREGGRGGGGRGTGGRGID
jgi:4-aminobutyrate--pyruvate transaminase